MQRHLCMSAVATHFFWHLVHQLQAFSPSARPTPAPEDQKTTNRDINTPEAATRTTPLPGTSLMVVCSLVLLLSPPTPFPTSGPYSFRIPYLLATGSFPPCFFSGFEAGKRTVISLLTVSP